MGGNVARLGDKRNPYNFLMGRPEGNKPLENATHRCDHYIKIYFQEI
jgi:hypothetical protein